MNSNASNADNIRASMISGMSTPRVGLKPASTVVNYLKTRKSVLSANIYELE